LLHHGQGLLLPLQPGGQLHLGHLHPLQPRLQLLGLLLLRLLHLQGLPLLPGERLLQGPPLFPPLHLHNTPGRSLLRQALLHFLPRHLLLPQGSCHLLHHLGVRLSLLLGPLLLLHQSFLHLSLAHFLLLQSLHQLLPLPPLLLQTTLHLLLLHQPGGHLLRLPPGLGGPRLHLLPLLPLPHQQGLGAAPLALQHLDPLLQLPAHHRLHRLHGAIEAPGGAHAVVAV